MTGHPLKDPSHPDRPEHPDFWRINEIALQLDGQATEAGRRLDEIVAEVVDPQSLAYQAFHRAMKILGVESKMDLLAMQAQVARLATVYHEAFLVGYRFHERGGHQG